MFRSSRSLTRRGARWLEGRRSWRRGALGSRLLPRVVPHAQRLHRVGALTLLDVVIANGDVGEVLAVVVRHAGRIILVGDGNVGDVRRLVVAGHVFQGIAAAVTAVIAAVGV